MTSIVVAVEAAVADYVARIATRDGVSLEKAAGDLLREGLTARARREGKTLLAELRERSNDAPSDDAAIAIAVEEQGAMRSERRASSSS